MLRALECQRAAPSHDPADSPSRAPERGSTLESELLLGRGPARGPESGREWPDSGYLASVIPLSRRVLQPNRALNRNRQHARVAVFGSSHAVNFPRSG